MNNTGIVRSNLYLEHFAGDWHPESPKRLEVIHNYLDSNFIPGLQFLKPRAASREEITLVHDQNHYDLIAQTTSQPQCYLDADTQTCARSFEAALFAAGGLILLVEKVLNGELDNGFALVRPPGHHAEASRPMGFCLFNNIAIAAAWALKERGLSRIMIIDWDLHHGNGTQHSFYEDPRVLYFSTHLYPFYPGTGSFSETGKGQGKGYTVNVPMDPKQDDKDFVAIFQKIAQPLIKTYRPELILVSAGFDTHVADPMQGMTVTPEGYAAMTYILKTMAEKICDGKLVLTLEGGYHFMGQADSVLKVLEVLTGSSSVGKELADTDWPEPVVINRVRKVHNTFWGL
ncbi:MAG: histone deacetylase [Deltaproteobacteria bacterium]|nr:histone deacetylase [Deltaproteobacteria bacterium]MBW2052039.1 histone deacetylase [Deltaproteobacteria bacterium]MBW2141506.1 histone deacetylase [Deltaproteobacteria bacterium]MBW2323405.1 histone deacetylase [Deltaproteobacteria bacterium]